jgi:hypothetical protein
LLLYSSHLSLGVPNGLVIYQASPATREKGRGGAGRRGEERGGMAIGKKEGVVRRRHCACGCNFFDVSFFWVNPLEIPETQTEGH